METSQKGFKSIIFTLVLWGLVQVACGLSLLVTVMGYWEHILFPLNQPLFAFAVAPIFINAGTFIIAFAFVRGKFLRIAVFVTSFLSMILGASLSFLLTVSRHGTTQGYDEAVYLLQVTIGMVIALGNSFTSVFFSLFLPRCCASTTPGVVYYIEEEMDNPLPPPYYHQPLETMSFVECQGLTSFGNHQIYQATDHPPHYTSTDWTRYQASTLDECEKFPSVPD